MARRGVFPGSFNPPTVAHLAIADRARREHRLTGIDLVVSRRPLGKDVELNPRFDDRLEVLRRTVADLPWLNARVTNRQLLVDIARGYDIVIMGADKWWQIQQVRWYGSPQQRDMALEQLPEVALFDRSGHDRPDGDLVTLADDLRSVSSTRARNGEHHLMTEAARRFAEQTGAWIDPDRYNRWSTEHPNDTC